ncbi:MAG: sigma-54 dependent transcriptional regulator [Desulfovibrionaceae bacterium]|nr:sigma-54 dependent transcriptional regulator [Desulfovibrionaceae bacterium]
MKSESPAVILIVDDEEGIRFSLRGILEDEGYVVLEAGSGEEGLALLQQKEISLVLLDIWLPGQDGLQALEKIHLASPQLPVLMISGHATIEHAVAAIKRGAHDLIEKPLSLEKVLIAVSRSLEFRALQRENQALRLFLPSRQTEELLGQSAPMRDVRAIMDKVAPLDSWVLLTGENGTGKEIASRYIHALSRRAGKPLVAVNCAAIPEELIESELFGHEKGAFTGAENAKAGKFELAHRGTLFLDEIGDMSLKTQAKILRLLQEQTFERVGGNKTISVDVRVIAATNKNLEQAIAGGQFREDLYYRLRVFPLHLPPLRERSEDILPMLDHFLRRLGRDYALKPISFDAAARQTLLHYRWPGNVRELRNFVERMLILHSGKELGTGDLPPEMSDRLPSARESITETTQDAALYGNDFKAARNAFEARYLAKKLREFGGNISKMAETVGLERSYLHRKLKSLGL